MIQTKTSIDVLTEEFKKRTFRLNDIEEHVGLHERVAKETQNIYENPIRRNGRDISTINKDVLKGIGLEFLLEENYNFSFHPNIYHDLYNTSDPSIIVECKAFDTTDVNDYKIRKALIKIRKAKADGWQKSTHMLVYTCDKRYNYRYLTTILI